MKVALDATPLTEPTGGIRRYTMELVKALAHGFPQDEYILISDQSYQDPHLCGVRAVSGTGSGRWWSHRLPQWLARERIELFHGTDFAVPYWPARPAVMTVHDLSPWRSQASTRVRRRTPWLLRFGLHTMVITPSEAVKREVIEFFGLPPEEVVAIPHGAADHFHPVAAAMPDTPYFLYVGTLEPRKNPAVIIDAWCELRRRGHLLDLVLAGRARTGFPTPPPQPGLRVLGETPDADLPRLYSQATAVLYPSLYEGFGLPVLEAMQCGAVVLASRDPAVSELAAGAILQIDARDTKGWTEAMESALGETGHWRDAARRRASLFSWSRTAAQTREVYLRALRRFHG